MEQQQLTNFKQLIKTKGRSDRTIKTYEYWINKLLTDTNKTPENISKDDIINFLNHKRKTVSVSSMIVMRSAFKLFFEKYLKMKDLFDDGIPIKTTHKNKIIIVSSEEEIQELLEGVPETNRLRGQLIIQLAYDASLRVSDLRKLEYKNIYKNGNILIRCGKGGKDRVTTWELKKTWKLLQEYLILSNPKKYLFEKKNGKLYDDDTFQRTLRVAGKNSSIPHPTSGIHHLRHSGSSKWYKNKPLEDIQEKLGHANINTTLLYVKHKNKFIEEDD